MADIEVSKTGKWIDGKTGKVVSSEPEEGRLLCPPGGELTIPRRSAIEAAELAAKGGDGEVKTVTSSTVETATASESTRKSSK